MLSLGHNIATLAFEVLGILCAVAFVAVVMIGRRPTRGEVRVASAAVVSVLALVFAVGEIPSGAALLIQADRASTSSKGGADYCFGQGWPDNPGGSGVARLPFVQWLKARLGRSAVYSLDYAPPPDPGCLYLDLLPALPAVPGEHAEWTIAFGAVPAEMQAKIAAHDPSVRVFAPGLALQYDGKT